MLRALSFGSSERHTRASAGDHRHTTAGAGSQESYGQRRTKHAGRVCGLFINGVLQEFVIQLLAFQRQ